MNIAMSTTALSPFLPGTQIQYAYDSTSLGWLKECPRKYFYCMVEGWRTKSETVHLDFGIWYHRGLELYDRLRASGVSHEEAVEKMVGEALAWTWIDDKPWSPDHPSKSRETLIRSLVWYVEHFKDDPAKTLILANDKPAVELSFKLELDQATQGVRYVLCGHMDRVVNYLDGIYVCDRKTTSSTITQSYFDQYNPDNQMSLYTFAGKIIYNLPIKGVVIDAAQIAVGFTRFARGFTHRTEAQLEEWLSDTYVWFRRAEEFAQQGYWPMNDRSCHKYGGCPFRKVCSKSPEVRAHFLKTDFYKKEWNPLIPRGE